MTLWYDLSTSLGSKGMTGTVRTELEVCRALQKKLPGLRIFRFAEKQFELVDRTTHPWLFDLNRPIGQQYLESLAKPKGAESAAARDEHVERLTKFALEAAPHPLDRGRNSVLFALSMLPPALVEVLLETLGPHSDATFQIARRLTEFKPQPATEATDTTPDPVHPFAAGDRILTIGIDWAQDFLPLLARIREKTKIEIHQVVHDLTPIVVPQFHVERNCELYREFFLNVAKTVDCAWYISEQTRLDAEQTLTRWRLPPVKSRQVRWGSEPVKPDGRTTEQRKAMLATRGVTRPYFLFVSTIEARKNHETVYRAYRALVKKHGDTIPQLVFIGHGGWKRSEFLGWLHRDQVVKGHLKHFSANDAELDALYRECLFTVYPSLYEGWGLPIVESHSYGKAVIVSDSPSLREAAGPATEAVEALSVQAWTEVLEKWLFDAGHRAAATQKQLAAFKPTSWSDTADQFLAGMTP